MESQAGKSNKIKPGKNNKASKTEALYKRLELKLDISQKLIRDQHKRFLKSHPRGEMTRDDFVDFLQSEKNIKPYVAKSLFRSEDIFSQQIKPRLQCVWFMNVN